MNLDLASATVETPAPKDLGTPDWMLSARCRDSSPTRFFPADGSGVSQAIAVCAACPVRTACLGYALEHNIEFGVWGGTSERERRRIKRRRDFIMNDFSLPHSDELKIA